MIAVRSRSPAKSSTEVRWGGANMMQARSPSGLETVRAFLKGNALLGGLPDAELDSLVRKGYPRMFAKGDVIYRRGEPGDNLMVILSGQVKITNVNADFREVVLAFQGTDDIVGEIAVLHSKRRTANAVALEDTEALLIPARDVLIALTANPQAMIEMSQMLCERLQTAFAIIEDSASSMRTVWRNWLRALRRSIAIGSVQLAYWERFD
jgi:CRP-like cAMP-binding protein